MSLCAALFVTLCCVYHSLLLRVSLSAAACITLCCIVYHSLLFRLVEATDVMHDAAEYWITSQSRSSSYHNDRSLTSSSQIDRRLTTIETDEERILRIQRVARERKERSTTRQTTVRNTVVRQKAEWEGYSMKRRKSVRTMLVFRIGS